MAQTSRIPTFHSKITKIPTKKSQKINEEITIKDLGRRVRVAEKEGILRYFGNVEFSDGIWCGVELYQRLGKNDGFIKGKRYFACAPNYGLMVPLSKLKLIDDDDDDDDDDIDEDSNEIRRKNYENLDDDTSGPYSILFIDNHKTKNIDKNEQKVNDNNLKVNQENVEVFTDQLAAKRRRTYLIERRLEKPTSLPHLRNCSELIDNVTTTTNKFEENLLKKLQTTTNLDEETNKRDSLELEESLGILTPEQMIDNSNFLMNSSRTPSLECLEISNEPPPPPPQQQRTELPSPNVTTDFSFGIIDEQLLKSATTMNMELPLDSLQSKDYNTLTRLEETPSPEDLPLDPTPIITTTTSGVTSVTTTIPMTTTINESVVVGQTKNLTTTKSSTKTSSSCITSITSITSLDNGYQGDGEMSRPGSRCTTDYDNNKSPINRRQLIQQQQQQIRRGGGSSGGGDPMTDSDFYTESDADNHDDNNQHSQSHLKGDRRAQVIDGTLYGVDPQATADIYVNNRENMDSSGIFTDIETNLIQDNSPTDTITTNTTTSSSSTTTIASNNQNHLEQINELTTIKNLKSNNNNNNHNNNKKDNISEKMKENPKKRNAPSPLNSSPSNLRNHSKDEMIPTTKKYKTPERKIISKVKTMLQTNNNNNNNNKNNTKIDDLKTKKSVGRWDAVMSKISKNEPNQKNLKDIKSKVFNNITYNNNSSNNNTTKIDKKINPRTATNLKNTNLKPRRVRVRSNASSKSNDGSINSSISDLSTNVSSSKSVIGSAKKRDIVQVTQVLTPSKLSPRRPLQNNTNEAKKSSPSSYNRELLKPKQSTPIIEKKQTKEYGRTIGKGGRTSPIVRPPNQTRTTVTKPTPKVVEALAVLVQHLVFNVEAFKVPVLKREIQKLEAALLREQNNHQHIINEAQIQFTQQLHELEQKHENEILEINNDYNVKIKDLYETNNRNNQEILKENEEKLLKLKIEFEKLQKTHQESLEILQEENDSIREQIDEKNMKINELKNELNQINRENQKLKLELSKIHEKFNERLEILQEDNTHLRQENDRLLNYSENKSGIQEVQSLRVVLELKQNEVAELRRNLAEITQKNEILNGAEEKAQMLKARCEDLQLQLQRKSEHAQSLMAENKRLQETIKDEISQRERMIHHNEQLQWKLKHKQEVNRALVEQAGEQFFNRNNHLQTASFNERHLHTNTIITTQPIKQEQQQQGGTPKNFERTLSFREPLTTKFNENLSSEPTSPRVKGVIEKSDWVSYVLDLDESPEIVASRIIRRSFRNTIPATTTTTTSTKTTPTKSPSNKRPRMKNPLSLSASASSILTSNKQDYTRSHSLLARNGGDYCNFNPDEQQQEQENCSNVKAFSTPKKNNLLNNSDDNLDFDDDEDDGVGDLKLPALPSEIGRNSSLQALPSPKHLAGESMISESNSDDESTSSSSVQL